MNSFEEFAKLIIALVLSFVITVSMKRLTKRPRPVLPEAKAAALRFNFRSAEKNFSMPSGDTMQSATYWSAMVAKGMIHPPTAIMMVTCTMVSRVYY